MKLNIQLSLLKFEKISTNHCKNFAIEKLLLSFSLALIVVEVGAFLKLLPNVKFKKALASIVEEMGCDFLET